MAASLSASELDELRLAFADLLNYQAEATWATRHCITRKLQGSWPFYWHTGRDERSGTSSEGRRRNRGWPTY
jgi:hypothetical protein